MLKRHRIIAISIVILVALMTLAGSCFDFIQKDQDIEALTVGKEVIEDIGKVLEDDQQTEDQSADSPKTSSEKPTPRYDPFQVILDYGGFDDDYKRNILDLARKDPQADWIYSIAEMIVSKKMAETDILFFTELTLMFLEPEIEAFFGNTLFPCGEDIDGGFVVCAEDPQPIEPGAVYLTLIKLAEPVPVAHPDRFYTYAAVFDSDGEEGNNFQFVPPFDWDYFQGTDRWYMLEYFPGTGWLLNLYDTESGVYGFPTGARAVIMGDILAFFIPGSEFSVDSPGYRVTTFGHDGTFSQESSCGDVSGANPTEPLLQIEGDPLTVE